MTETALKALRKRVAKDRDQAMRAALTLAEHGDGSIASDSDLEFALGRVEQLDARLKMLPKITKISEPDIYRRGGPDSFFADMVASTSPLPYRNIPPHEAHERLARHQRHEERRLGVEHDLATRQVAREGIQPLGVDDGVQMRALSAEVAGSGGEFVPPAWIVEDFASVSRAACPLRQIVRSVPLPDRTLELHIPRFDVASGVLPESVENISTGDDYSPPTDAIVAPVRTFVGSTIVSQQMHERGGIDSIVTADFGEAYGADLEYQLVNGTGTNGQLLGLLNVSSTAISAGVPGAVMNTFTSANPTTSAVHQAIAQLAADVADARERPPSALLLTPRRFFWFAGFGDTSGEPSIRPGTGLVAKQSDIGPFGPVAGLPTYLDATIPSNLGTGANQDAAIVVRGKDILLLEEPTPRFTAYVDTAAGANQMAVVLSYHRYVAAFTSRYPSAIGSVTGTGFVVPSNF